jgi:hypothetical protein
MRTQVYGQQVSSQHRLSLAIPFLCFLLAALMGWGLFGVEKIVPALLPGIAVTVLASLPIVKSLAEGSFDIFEIINPICVMYLLYFPVRAWYVLSVPDAKLAGNLPYADTIPTALLYTAIGLLAMLVGYYSRVPVRLAAKLPRLPTWLENPPVARIVVVAAVGLISQVYWFSKVGIIGASLWTAASNAESYGFLVQFAVFFQFALVIASVYLFRHGSNKGSLRLLVAFLFTTQLCLAILSASKIMLVLPFAVAAIVYHYSRHRLSTIRISIIAVIIILAFFPTMNYFRGNAMEEISPSHSDTRVASIADLQVLGDVTRAYFSAYQPSEYVNQAFNDLMGRSHGVDSLALIIRYTGVLQDFRYGVPFLMTPVYAFVPRALWPSSIFGAKPYGTSAAFGALYFGSGWEGNITPVGMFTIGDLYLNLGLVGIVCGMFFLGVLYRILYEYLIQRELGPASIFLYAIAMWRVWYFFETGFTGILIELLRDLVILGGIVWFLRDRTRRRCAPKPLGSQSFEQP